MSYSTDPIKDAYRHTARMDAENEALEELTRHYTSIIEGVLTKGIRRLDHQVLSLPFVGGLGTELTQMPLAEAIEMEAVSPHVLRYLMRVLAESDCPRVEALRVAIAKSYAATFADICAREALS